MSTYAHDWKPGNHGGAIYDDPRDELAYWANTAAQGYEMVAVPVALLRAVARLRVCRATHVMTHDEDGELPSPASLHCNKPEGHRHMHYNGYANWGER